MDSNREQPFERRESEADIALRILERYSERLNEDLGFELVDEEGRLLMERFLDDDAPGYDAEEIEDDADHVRRKEIQFAGLDNERVISFKADEAGIDSSSKETETIVSELLEYERRKKYREAPGQAEVVIPLTLARALGERYLVVRTSEYDDFESGVDHVMIDKESGLVVCAIDEVVESAASTRVVEKKVRAERKQKRGGTSVKYGVRYQDGELVKGRLHNLATFIMPISKENVRGCLQELSDNSVGRFSQSVVAHITESMEEQLENIRAAGHMRFDERGLLEAIRRMKEFSE